MEGNQLDTIFFFILYFIATVLKRLLSSGKGACMIEHLFLPLRTVCWDPRRVFSSYRAHVVLRSALYWYRHKKHVSSTQFLQYSAIKWEHEATDIQFTNTCLYTYKHAWGNGFEQQANVCFHICYYQNHNVTASIIHDVIFHWGVVFKRQVFLPSNW